MRLNLKGSEEVKHSCDELNKLMTVIKEKFPEYENISPPVELFSGKIYLEFAADKPYKGKKKQVNVPVLLKGCPFCGEKYTD